jgi:hypothetical protein
MCGSKIRRGKSRYQLPIQRFEIDAISIIQHSLGPSNFAVILKAFHEFEPSRLLFFYFEVRFLQRVRCVFPHPDEFAEIAWARDIRLLP